MTKSAFNVLCTTTSGVPQMPRQERWWTMHLLVILERDRAGVCKLIWQYTCSSCKLCPAGASASGLLRPLSPCFTDGGQDQIRGNQTVMSGADEKRKQFARI